MNTDGDNNIRANGRKL